jgi:hypothetical protein
MRDVITQRRLTCRMTTTHNTGNRFATAAAPARETNGIVEFVGPHRLVIRPLGREMAFILKPSTARVGHVRVGSKVDVRYRTEVNQRVATWVTVEQRAL